MWDADIMEATVLNNPLEMLSQSEAAAARWRIWVRGFAPVYFVGFSILRCYIEAQHLAAESYFSYYTALHHTLWNAATLLTIILVVHHVLKVPVRRLLWLMYGVTLMAIPVIYAILTGRHLQLAYLTGSFREIAGHIATFCFRHPVNRPLAIEILLIFLSMLVLGYAYTRSWPRAVLLAAAVHLLGNLLAVHWIGPVPHARSVVRVTSQLGHHQFMSSAWLLATTLLSVLLVNRAGWFGGSRRFWLRLILWALAAWIFGALIAHQTGWFEQPYDIFISGLTPATVAFLTAAALAPERRRWSKAAWAAAAVVVLLQLAVMGPVYLHEPAGFFSRPALPDWLVPVK